MGEIVGTPDTKLYEAVSIESAWNAFKCAGSLTWYDPVPLHANPRPTAVNRREVFSYETNSLIRIGLTTYGSPRSGPATRPVSR